jgi:hypothetical protein
MQPAQPGTGSAGRSWRQCANNPPPAARYVPSPGPPRAAPPLEYPGHFLVKRVTKAGTIRFKHRLLFLANALKQHHVGLEETDDGICSLYLGPVLLGRIDEREMRVYG